MATSPHDNRAVQRQPPPGGAGQPINLAQGVATFDRIGSMMAAAQNKADRVRYAPTDAAFATSVRTTILAGDIYFARAGSYLPQTVKVLRNMRTEDAARSAAIPERVSLAPAIDEALDRVRVEAETRAGKLIALIRKPTTKGDTATQAKAALIAALALVGTEWLALQGVSTPRAAALATDTLDDILGR